MCEKCEEIDQKLTRYRFMSRWVTDPKTLEALAVLIAKYEVEKRALHPEEK